MNPVGIFLREPWIEEFVSLEEMVARLLKIGFVYFELPQKHFFTEKEIGFLRNLKEKENIIYSVHSSSPCGLINLTNPNRTSFEFRLEQLFEFAKKIKASLINFDFDSCYKAELTWERKPNLCWRRMYQTLVSRTKLLLGYGKEWGIQVALENADLREPKLFDIVRFGMKAEDFLSLRKDCPAIKLTLDTGHLFLCATRYGFDLFEDFLEPLRSLIIHVHLSSNFGRDTGTGFKDYKKGIGDLHLPLQRGTLPWRQMVKFFLKNGYKGSFLLEIKPEKYKKTLRGILEEVQVSYDLLKSQLESCQS